ncbi:MAG: hypothetical protein Q4D16_19720 [Eubacteriales bacterium]|nr:hypothetical protein [Eubacteriales bacterium]
MTKLQIEVQEILAMAHREADKSHQETTRRHQEIMRLIENYEVLSNGK